MARHLSRARCFSFQNSNSSRANKSVVSSRPLSTNTLLSWLSACTVLCLHIPHICRCFVRRGPTQLIGPQPPQPTMRTQRSVVEKFRRAGSSHDPRSCCASMQEPQIKQAVRGWNAAVSFSCRAAGYGVLVTFRFFSCFFSFCSPSNVVLIASILNCQVALSPRHTDSRST